jgi:hypothetical protein
MNKLLGVMYYITQRAILIQFEESLIGDTGTMKITMKRTLDGSLDRFEYAITKELWDTMGEDGLIIVLRQMHEHFRK